MNPVELLKKLSKRMAKSAIYVAGGPVRDWLLDKAVKDIDLVMSEEGISAARYLANVSSGSFVMLDEGFHVARVVVKETSFDFSQYRGDATNIEEDLSYRDFTINAMAIPLDLVLPHLFYTQQGAVCPKDAVLPHLVDPFEGRKDLEKRTIRAISLSNLSQDPLRMLRAFRFKAILGFDIEPKTLEWIKGMADGICRSAPERISTELDKIMASSRAGKSLMDLKACGLLMAIIPETETMEGVEQPGFHHLDVLGHLIETVSSMDALVEDPCIKFPDCGPFRQWLLEKSQEISWLKWAAFMHDFGKPSKKGMKENGRVTFYEHDKEGARMVKAVSRRLRWSRQKTKFVANLVRLHMRPFHLLNDLRRSGPSKRAMRRLLDEIGEDYPALFLLSMADSMAGCGPMKPEGLDDEIAKLFNRIHHFYLKSLKPVEESPPLVKGNDVMEILGIGPGPLVGQVLKAVKEAQVEGVVSNRKQALAFIEEGFKEEAAPFKKKA